jgi:hypothetical protein
MLDEWPDSRKEQRFMGSSVSTIPRRLLPDDLSDETLHAGEECLRCHTVTLRKALGERDKMRRRIEARLDVPKLVAIGDVLVRECTECRIRSPRCGNDEDLPLACSSAGNNEIVVRAEIDSILATNFCDGHIRGFVRLPG